MMTQGIYKIEHIESGRCYIGSSIEVEKRLGVHRYLLLKGRHHAAALQHGWNKYGADGFSFQLVEVVADRNFLHAREQFWIWRWDAYGHGFNSLPIAQSLIGYRHLPEVRRKMSLAKMGKPSPRRGVTLSPEVRKKVSDARRGQKAPPGAIARMAEANRGKPLSRERRARISAAIKLAMAEGRFRRTPAKWTPEMRLLASLKQRGRKVSTGTRARLSAALRGHETTAEARAALSAAHRGRKRTTAHRQNIASAMHRFWDVPANRASRANAVRDWWARRKATQGAAP